MRCKWMTRSQLGLGIAVVALAVAAGVVSERYVDRRFAKAPHELTDATSTPPAAPNPVPTSACVNADGTWRNWTSPNVPMLSPKCEDGK
ncbi:hypothetical protein BH11PSE4_BH11PSE4_06720 [soil metagenome]